MSFKYSKKIGNLTINCESEVLLNGLESKISPSLAEDAKGYLWAFDDLSIAPEWDLNYWVSRCYKIFRENDGEVALFEYDIKFDTKKRLPLLFTSTDTVPTQATLSSVSNELPISYQGRKSAFFLDRDGIINEDRSYVFKSEDVTFVKGISEFIKFLHTKFDYVIVLTNQSGIGRGYYCEGDVLTLHKWMQVELEKDEAIIDNWYYCPYHPDGESREYRKDSYLRKPGSAMALRAASEYELDLSRCAMVGDKDSDYLTDLQMKTFLLEGNYPLKSGHEKFKSLEDLMNYLIVSKA